MLCSSRPLNLCRMKTPRLHASLPCRTDQTVASGSPAEYKSLSLTSRYATSKTSNSKTFHKTFQAQFPDGSRLITVTVLRISYHEKERAYRSSHTTNKKTQRVDAPQLSCCGSHDRLCGRLPSATARLNNILCKMSDGDLFMSVF